MQRILGVIVWFIVVYISSMSKGAYCELVSVSSVFSLTVVVSVGGDDAKWML